MAILFILNVFARILLRGGSHPRNIIKFSFWYLTWRLNSGLMSNKPTHYPLDLTWKNISSVTSSQQTSGKISESKWNCHKKFLANLSCGFGFKLSVPPPMYKMNTPNISGSPDCNDQLCMYVLVIEKESVNCY